MERRATGTAHAAGGHGIGGRGIVERRGEGKAEVAV